MNVAFVIIVSTLFIAFRTYFVYSNVSFCFTIRNALRSAQLTHWLNTGTQTQLFRLMMIQHQHGHQMESNIHIYIEWVLNNTDGHTHCIALTKQKICFIPL